MYISYIGGRLSTMTCGTAEEGPVTYVTCELKRRYYQDLHV